MADKRCETCTEECPKAQMAHDAAVGRMYATKEFIALQKKVESGLLVEVVRCQDCRFYEAGVEYYGGGTKDICRLFKRQMQPDAFCSVGERRDGKEG